MTILLLMSVTVIRSEKSGTEIDLQRLTILLFEGNTNTPELQGTCVNDGHGRHLAEPNALTGEQELAHVRAWAAGEGAAASA